MHNRRRSRRANAMRAAALESLESRMLLSTFTVLNTDTDPLVENSLPWAIEQANAQPGHDVIDFAIDGGTIWLTDALPAITESVTIGVDDPDYAGLPVAVIEGMMTYGVDGLVIDADNVTIRGLAINDFLINSGIVVHGANAVIEASQLAGNEIGILVQGANAQVRANILGGDFMGNSDGIVVDGAYQARIEGNAIYGSGDNGIVVTNFAEGTGIAGNLIGLDPSGALAGNYGDGIELNNALFTTIAGNTISGNYGDGIRLEGASGSLIAGNRIGVGPAGDEPDFGNYGDGIGIHGTSTANIIGGTGDDARNVVSNNGGDGISLYSGTSNRIEGNFAGTDVTGTLALPNWGDGISITAPAEQTIIVRNLASGNSGSGIRLADGAVVKGNLVGTQADGQTPLPNGIDGISIEGTGNIVGGIDVGDGNTVAFNTSAGIAVYSGAGNSLRGDSIFANGGLGIDLGADGVTANESAGHSGPNLFQNFPILDSAATSGASLHVAGSFVGAPSATFIIDFYASSAADPTGYGEGQTFLGSITLTTDAAGNATIDATLPAPAGAAFITATATDEAGNTSEFSLAVESEAGTVSQPTQTTLVSSPNPSTYGQAVTLTATVTTSGGAPAAGSVIFFEGTLALGPAVALDDSGLASFSTATFTVGAHGLSALFLPDTGFADSQSLAIEHRVNPADLYITAGSATRIYGQANPIFSATITGFVLNEDAAVLDGTLTIGTLATATSPVGGYAITPAGVTADNYAIHFVDGVLDITAAALTVTADNASRLYGQDNPVFTATFDGFVLGEDVSALAGTLAFSTAATAGSPTGSYAITPGGLISTNYAIHFVDGTLDITAAALTVTADNASRLYGQDNPVFTATFDGFVLGEDVSALAGTLAFSTAATAGSPTGSYAITPGGLASTNYDITFIDGTLQVNAASTQTTLSASTTLLTPGQPVALTASVAVLAPGGGSPAGTVTFIEGATVLGTASISDGVATLELASLPVGAHSIFAVYGGSDNHLASESSPVTLTVQTTAFNASGKIWRDLSGNGLSVDDIGLGDILVQLFTDKNNNSKLEPSDGPAIASIQSDADGDYAFSIDGTGRYLIQAQLPDGFVRTFPHFDSFHAVQATAGGSRTDIDFAFTKPCTAKADGVTVVYIINGTTTVTDLRGKVNEGDTVEARFTIATPDTYRLTLVSYTAPGATFIAEDAYLQEVFDEETGVFTGPGTFSLTVDVPDSYFQIDAICGRTIDRFGPAGSNIFYTPQGRLFSADNDGNNLHVAGSASIAGFIYLDADNDGSKDLGEKAITGATVRLSGTNTLGQSVTAAATTDSRGRYVFANLLPGTYDVVEVQPAGYADGLDSLGSGGGTMANDQFTIVIDTPGVNKDYNFGELQAASLSGAVFSDKNANGVKNSGENGIGCVTLSLLDLSGNVVATTQTNSCGIFSFTGLLPGTYTLLETQPDGYVDGEEIAGSLGGDVTGDNNVIADIVVGAGQNGSGYNFTEYPERDVTCGDAASICFWRNKNGQNLIKGLNGSQNSKTLGNWLAQSFPNIYGAGSPNCLVNKTNSQVASKFLSLYNVSGMKLDAQVMAVALAVYCTDTDLAGTAAKKYGFAVSSTGTGMRTYDIGTSGAAFGAADHTEMLVQDILSATDAQAVDGVLYNGDQILRVLANAVFDGINDAGGIG